MKKMFPLHPNCSFVFGYIVYLNTANELVIFNNSMPTADSYAAVRDRCGQTGQTGN